MLALGGAEKMGKLKIITLLTYTPKYAIIEYVKGGSDYELFDIFTCI